MDMRAIYLSRLTRGDNMDIEECDDSQEVISFEDSDCEDNGWESSGCDE